MAGPGTTEPSTTESLYTEPAANQPVTPASEPAATSSVPESSAPPTSGPTVGGDVFNHVVTFNVIDNLAAGEDPTTPTVAEIVDATADGMTLVYIDADSGRVGFVDISDPAAPAALGAIDAGGGPTSVAVVGDVAYASVNTGDFANPSGTLLAIDVATQTIASETELAGQPDSVAARHLGLGRCRDRARSVSACPCGGRF
jgi:hypothetical protein